MHAQSAVDTHVLLDMREDSFERIRGVGDVQLWMIEVNEQVWQIPLHAVVGAPQSGMSVMPAPCVLIDRPLFEKRPPLVVPEFQPQRELRFTDLREMPHQCLQVLSCFELRPPCDVPCDDGCLVEVAHLHGHGKSLQQATSAVADDGSDPPSPCLQRFNATLVRINGFVGKELPQEILFVVGTPPHHHAEQPLEVRGVHDDDHFVGSKLLLLNFNTL